MAGLEPIFDVGPDVMTTGLTVVATTDAVVLAVGGALTDGAVVPVGISGDQLE
jgi:hypothetical protein